MPEPDDLMLGQLRMMLGAMDDEALTTLLDMVSEEIAKRGSREPAQA